VKVGITIYGNRMVYNKDMVMKKTVIFLFASLMLQLSCSHDVVSKHNASKTQLLPVSQEQYIRDKQQIEKYVLNNIEYYRLHPYDYDTIPIDCANFFEPYSTFYNFLVKDYVKAPIPAYQYLKITVDTIVYDSCGLKCFIICGIEEKVINSESLMTRQPGRNFDAKSFIGVRTDLNDSLTIYPFVKYSIFGYDDFKEAVSDLEYLYFNKLKGETLSASHYRSKGFEQNVNDCDFFEKSIIFKKFNDSTYNYEYCYDNLIDYPYMK